VKAAMSQDDLRGPYQHVLSVTCPRCKANPGEPCMGRNGLPKKTPHPRRENNFQSCSKKPVLSRLTITTAIKNFDGWGG
jgi:hypothetical protein